MAFTVPLSVAPVLLMAVAAPVVAAGDAAEVVKVAVDDGKTLKELTRDDVVAKVKEVTGRDVDVSSSIIEKATDPKEALDAKRSPGSAHPGEMGRMVEERKEVLGRHVKDLDFLKIKITISKDNLKNALNQYRLQ